MTHENSRTCNSTLLVLPSPPLPFSSGTPFLLVPPTLHSPFSTIWVPLSSICLSLSLSLSLPTDDSFFNLPLHLRQRKDKILGGGGGVRSDQRRRRRSRNRLAGAPGGLQWQNRILGGLFEFVVSGAACCWAVETNLSSFFLLPLLIIPTSDPRVINCFWKRKEGRRSWRQLAGRGRRRKKKNWK